MNILVYPCDTEVAAEIQYALKNNKRFNLVGGTQYTLSKGSFIFDKIKTVDTISDIKILLRSREVDLIFPASDDACLEMSKYFPEETIGHSYYVNEIVRDKGSTYEFLKERVKTPKVYKKVFRKPRRGHSSKGIELIEEDDKKFITEYLPGKEYTVDCISQESRLVFSGARERVVSRAGIAEICVPYSDKKLEDMAEEINKAFSFNGAWFFQTKEDEFGEHTLLEIGPRISGGMSMFRMSGINFPELSIYCKLKIPINIKKEIGDFSFCKFFKPKFKVDLSFDNVYIDYDDCLIIGGLINTELISFIYQCLNENKNIFLITRSNKDINKNVVNLFTDVIRVQKGERKSKFIRKNSVFIDDSFSEREDITDPTIRSFSIDNFNVLLK